MMEKLKLKLLFVCAFALLVSVGPTAWGNGDPSKLVYENVIDPVEAAYTGGPYVVLADDMDLAGTERELVRYEFGVVGFGGSYDVMSELYTDDGGQPGSPIPGTSCTHVSLPSGIDVYLNCPVDPGVTVPDTVWMVLTLTDPNAGWIIAEAAEVGSTADVVAYHDGMTWNLMSWGGDPWAGCWARIWCSNGGGEDYINPGTDYWSCPDANFAFGGGCLSSVPADFFGPGSDPFDGVVCCSGDTLHVAPQLDFTVERTSQGHVPPPYPSGDEIELELTELALVSVEPITITYDGGMNPELWDVGVALSPDQHTEDANCGISATKTHANGGMFVVDANVLLKFTFTKADDPGEVRIWDAGLEERPPLVFTTTDPYAWEHTPDGNDFQAYGEEPMVLNTSGDCHISLLPYPMSTDSFWVQVDMLGEAVGGGSGYNGGEWYYYPNTNWWNEWFYDHPYDPNRMKVIDVNFTIRPFDPCLPSWATVAYNWSTPDWLDPCNPPLPPLDPVDEDLLIRRSIFFESNLQLWPQVVQNHFEIPDYNPQWISIDVNGFNFEIIDAEIDHACLPKDGEPQPKPPVPNLKWSQPPIEIDPNLVETPVYCGWDQPSYTILGYDWYGVADDFRCLGSMPITSIHWWGSYYGWEVPGEWPPPFPLPIAWRIGFWSNVPAGAAACGNCAIAHPWPGCDDPVCEAAVCSYDDWCCSGVWDTICAMEARAEPACDCAGAFSYPGELLWQIEVPADRVDFNEVGTDDYYGLYPYEVCYQYYLELEPDEVFWQDHYVTEDNVYWLSITAVYDSLEIANPWGWKTRPWSWMDDAVMLFLYPEPQPGTVLDPAVDEIHPIVDPVYGESFDVAFELDTDPCYVKWEQPFTGIRDWPHYHDEQSMAHTEPVTVTKWQQDPDPFGWDVAFLGEFGPIPLELADDWQCDETGTVDDIHFWYSWPQDFVGFINSVTVRIYSDDPCDPTIPGDYSEPNELLWERTFLDGEFGWIMDGTGLQGWFDPWSPMVAIQDHLEYFRIDIDQIDDPFIQEQGNIYWLSIEMDTVGNTAGWKTSLDHWIDKAVYREPGGLWRELYDPLIIAPLDLAFAITTEKEELDFSALVADDWPCDDNAPVTAAAWWGSYIGYSYEACQGPPPVRPMKPDYFWLTIWDDVPAGVDLQYSHPNNIIWKYDAVDFDEVLVGYDKHPHGQPNEPVFRYSVRIPEEDWFCQNEPNDVYWFSVVAVYEDVPDYNWGWTNHKHVYNDDAVTGYPDVGGPVPAWSWFELYDQNDASEDMSFILFTEPDCFPSTDPKYPQWVLQGKPRAWCCRYQSLGDVTGDGASNIFDLFAFRTAYGTSYPNPGYDCRADLNHDGAVNIFDLFIFRNNYGTLFEANYSCPWKDDCGPHPCP